MQRHDTPMTAVLVVILALALLATACGNGSSEVGGDGPATTGTEPSTPTSEPEEPNPDPTAEIMAEAAHQLVTVDHTFGNGPSPFVTFLVQDHIDPTAGAAEETGGANARPLTDAERDAIESRLSSLGEVRWIDDPADFRTDDLTPTIDGAVIIGLGEPTIEGDTALAPVSLWCGGLCGTWFTYSLARGTEGQWAIDGIEGPIAIS